MRAGRPRRNRTVRESLGSIVLGFEAVIVFLATLVAFGLKAAGWLDALQRARRRLRVLRDEALALQLGGAAGTLASLQERGLDVAQALASELKLPLPALPWHAARDRIVEVGTPAEIFDTPREERTRNFLGAVLNH